jgi:hypothetical protein
MKRLLSMRLKKEKSIQLASSHRIEITQFALVLPALGAGPLGL